MKKYLSFFIVLVIGILIGKYLLSKPAVPQNTLDPHPQSAVVERIIDGDTFVLNNNQIIRLNGINASSGESSAKAYLEKNIPAGKQVFLEYDRYQEDQYGRLLAWVFIDCESPAPSFLPYDYMHKSQNESNIGLSENPEGCKNGKLINEELVKLGFAKVEVYKDRGKLKYEDRIKKIEL